MATKTARLQMVIAGDNKGAAKALGDTEKRLSGLKGQLGGLGAGLAGAFSVGAVVAFGKQSVSTYQTIAGQVAGIKRMTGESAEGASLLAFAAQQSGIDANKASVGWRTLAKNIDSGKVAAEGISTVGSDGGLASFDEILGNIADRVQELPPGFQRTALAQRLFGRSGADMVKVLQNGRQGIEDLRSEMQSYGLEFSDAGLKKYTEFVKAQRDMKAALTGVQVEVGQRIIPVFTKMAEAAAFFGQLPEPVKTGAVAIGGLALAVGGLNLAYGALQPIWDRGFVSMIRNATASASLAGAETLAAEAAAAEAAATAALTAALTTAGPAEAEFAAAASARATASTASAAAAEAEAAATGGLGAGMGGLAVAGGIATGVVAVLGAAYMSSAAQARHAKDDTDALIESMKQGTQFTDAFAEKLAKDLSGEKGGFSLRGTGDKFREQLDRAGIGAKELTTALTGSKDEYDALIKKVQTKLDPGSAAILVYNLENLRDRGQDAIGTQEQMTEVNEALGIATEDTAAATDDLRTATEKLNDRMTEALRKQGDLTSARDAASSAAADSVRADYELAEARRAAAGDSDEYRDAEAEVAEAVAKVPEAQKEARDAVEDLNEARKDAADRLRDLAQAERDAALASADANLKVKEALNEQRRVNADPRSSALDKERAALTVAEAQNEARNAADEATKAQRDNAEAQRKGIEGDAEVVRAKESVRDANNAVRDAVNGVRDAEANAAQIITDAKAKVLEAQQAATDAALDEAKAWGDLVTQQLGAVAGAQAYRDKLAEIAADLDPSSPLATRIARLIEDINRAIDSGRGVNAPARPPTRDPDAGLPTSDGANGRRGTGNVRTPSGDSRSGSGELGIIVNQTFISQGTPVQQQRAQRQSTIRTLDEVARRLR